MTTATVHLVSEGLGKRATYNVILPRKGDGPFPVLIQLHGLGDDCHSWIEQSNLVRYAADYPLMIVLPDGGTSRYLNLEAGGRFGKQRYEDHIMKDITAHVRRNFNVTDQPWAIGGLSMGAYGAIRLGLKYPERFASIYAHSGSYQMPEIAPPFFMDTDDADVYRLASAVAGNDRRPAIAFDCGTEDERLGLNRAFHDHLEQIGLEHRYTEFPGGHDWDYWDLHVREALQWHADVFGGIY